MSAIIDKEKQSKMLELLTFLFGAEQVETIFSGLSRLIDNFNAQNRQFERKDWLDEKDVFLITYGDSIKEAGRLPLKSLNEFLKCYLAEFIEYVHILPFYPYSSDDGFSVIDYFKVNNEFGDWNDVEEISKDFKIMFDAVINHISAKNDWFQQYLKGNPEYENFFIEAEDTPELSKVFRPRALPLLTKFHTAYGDKLLWTTFSPDQIDLNYKEASVFLKIVELLLFYISKGAKAIRFDAVGFIWKEIGTACVHLPQTHAVIQLFREIFDLTAPETLIITETNVPHKENISYLGDGTNEAQLVYQFSLPPLVLYSFISGSARHLSEWADSLELASDRTAFFNFLASHDGIGIIPVQGILNEEELGIMLNQVKANGGNISYKTAADGTEVPYELNINYFDAVYDKNLSLETNIDKFMASQAVLLSITGVPAVYIHSLLGSRNYYEGVKQTSRFRTINREKLCRQSIEKELSIKNSLRSRIFKRYKQLIKIKRGQKAFHPNASQKIIFTNDAIFSLIRKAEAPDEAIIVLINVSAKAQNLAINLSKYGMGAKRLVDLVNEIVFPADDAILELKLAPYQTMWLKAKAMKK